MIMMVIKLLYFMLPAYFANMAPPLGKNMLKQMAVPIDRGKTWKGKPILGKNKTWRGVFLAVIAGEVVFMAQQYLYQYGWAESISLFDYSSATLWIGFLLGLGAIAGDSAESFFKRRKGIKSGKSWIPFDQTDFTIGALALCSIVYFPGWTNALIIVAVSALGHILVNHIGYYLKIRDVKW